MDIHKRTVQRGLHPLYVPVSSSVKFICTQHMTELPQCMPGSVLWAKDSTGCKKVTNFTSTPWQFQTLTMGPTISSPFPLHQKKSSLALSPHHIRTPLWGVPPEDGLKLGLDLEWISSYLKYISPTPTLENHVYQWQCLSLIKLKSGSSEFSFQRGLNVWTSMSVSA